MARRAPRKQPKSRASARRGPFHSRQLGLSPRSGVRGERPAQFRLDAKQREEIRRHAAHRRLHRLAIAGQVERVVGPHCDAFERPIVIAHGLVSQQRGSGVPCLVLCMDVHQLPGIAIRKRPQQQRVATVKMAVFAPMLSASVSTVAAVNAAFLAIMRNAHRMSRRTQPMLGSIPRPRPGAKAWRRRPAAIV